MELRKETVKQIRGLIVFTALLIVCLWKYDVVMDAFRFVLNILYPFLLGGAIAFVLSVPMNFVERKLFTERKFPEKYKRKYARGISLLIVLSGVIGLLAIIMFGLIPQLAGTFASLGKSIQDFIPQLQEWADHWFHNNKEIMNVVNNLEFDWNKVMEAAMEFLKNGAGSMLESTINTAKNIIGAVGTFFIAFVFAMYILLQKEKLGRQAKKVLFAFVRKGRAEAALEVLALTYKTFSSFLTGQCVEALILGSMFVIAMTLLRLPYALLTGGRCVSDIYGESGPGIDIYRTVPGTPADRGQSDLSACGGQFGRPSVYLGAGCGKYRRKPDGYRWNVDLYSADVSVLCFVPGSCLH